MFQNPILPSMRAWKGTPIRLAFSCSVPNFQGNREVFLRKTLQLPWKWGTEHEKARRIALAQCNLAVSFHHGNGVGQDKKEAVKYYRLTAEQGNSFRTLSVSEWTPNGRPTAPRSPRVRPTRIPETAGEPQHFPSSFRYL